MEIVPAPDSFQGQIADSPLLAIRFSACAADRCRLLKSRDQRFPVFVVSSRIDIIAT
jgi:hypothetical protein